MKEVGGRTFPSSTSDELSKVFELGSTRPTFERDDFFRDLVLVDSSGVA
jgi:hypothetical protein